jgi:UDP-2,3-diacylglucosamine pyrophosphatase LpxH
MAYHDFDRGKYPWAGVMKYIKNKYNATYSWSDYSMSGCYTYTHNGVQFISLGVYPKNLKWLASVLPADKSQPLVIFYHFNTDKNEPFGDWWKEEEKLAFYEAIKEHNVLLIINGHWHTSRITTWNNIKIVHCAGNPFVIKMADQQVKEIVCL